MPWIMKPYSRRQLTREERRANYRISRGMRVVENAFGILVSSFRVLLCSMEQRPRVVRDIVFTCLVMYNMLRTHQGRADRASTPINNAVAIENEQAVYVPNENYRNPSREGKYQQELLKDYFNHVGHWLGRSKGSGMCQPTTLGAEAGIYQSVLFRTTQLFQEFSFKLVSLKF